MMRILCTCAALLSAHGVAAEVFYEPEAEEILANGELLGVFFDGKYFDTLVRFGNSIYVCNTRVIRDDVASVCRSRSN